MGIPPIVATPCRKHVGAQNRSMSLNDSVISSLNTGTGQVTATDMFPGRSTRQEMNTGEFGPLSHDRRDSEFITILMSQIAEMFTWMLSILALLR